LTKKKKLFAYCRVSTKLQELENQRISIDKFLAYNQDKYEVIRWFEDEVSAFKERPAYERMLNILFDENNDVNGVIIQRLDRIGRSVKDLSQLLDKLENNNKKIIATEQNINPETIEGKLLTNILSSIAEFEADLFKERSREGRERYLAEKDKNGNLINKWGRKKIDISESLKKQLIKKYEDGLGTTKLSTFLKTKDIKMSPTTIYRRLIDWNVDLRKKRRK
jgi:DNA invertase Pin-like site-specific DNA recombinase